MSSSKEIGYELLDLISERKKTPDNFLSWAKTVFKEMLPEWSVLREKMANCLNGTLNEAGLFQFLIPRGTGKTTICKAFCAYCLLKHKKNFILFFSNSDDLAKQASLDFSNMLISREVEEYYPDVSFLIRKLKSSRSRLTPFTFFGKPFIQDNTARRFHLPGFLGFGGQLIDCATINSAFRGKQQFNDVTFLRPDLVIIDDPQSDGAARNQDRVTGLEKTIFSAILPLSYGSKNASTVICATAINRGDLTERLRNNPAVKTLYSKTIESFPLDVNLWDEWYVMFCDDKKKAAKFYAEHKAEMLDNYVVNDVAYDRNTFPDIFTAMMYEMRRDTDSFFSERQNEPNMSESVVDFVCNRETVEKAGDISVGIDVHHDVLFWTASTKVENKNVVLGYGVYPEQPLRHKKDEMLPFNSGQSLTEGIRSALFVLAKKLREKYKDALIIIDSGEGTLRKTIQDFCSQNKNIYPSVGVASETNPVHVSLFKRVPGDIQGENFILKKIKTSPVRVLYIDVNQTKSFMFDDFAVGNTVFSCPENPIFFQSFQAETKKYVETNTGYRGWVWKKNPKNGDNHFLDATVYSLTGLDVLERLKEMQKTADKMREINNIGRFG